MSYVDTHVHFTKRVAVSLCGDGERHWIKIETDSQFDDSQVESHEVAIFLRSDCVLDLDKSAAEAFAESRVQCTDCGAEVPEEFADEHWGKYRETVEPNGPDGYMYFCPKHDPGPEL